MGGGRRHLRVCGSVAEIIALGALSPPVCFEECDDVICFDIGQADGWMRGGWQTTTALLP